MALIKDSPALESDSKLTQQFQTHGIRCAAQRLLVALHPNPIKSDVWAADLFGHDGNSMLWLNATH
jgi:hypothetical protein